MRGPQIVLWSVVKFSSRQLVKPEPDPASESNAEKRPCVFVHRCEEIVAQTGNQREIGSQPVVIHHEAANDV